MVQQQTATTERSKKNNKMLLEKWQENEKHLREKGYKSTELNKALRTEKYKRYINILLLLLLLNETINDTLWKVKTL